MGKNDLIPVTGAGVQEPDQVWDRILDWMGEPAQVTGTTGDNQKLSASTTAKGGLSLFGLGKAEVTGGGGIESGTQSSVATTRARRGLTQVINEIGGSEFTVLLDDFHYMARTVQAEVAKQLKEAARQGVRLCVAAVPHRAEDVIRANPDLRGRVLSIDLAYWDRASLAQIAILGFGKLNVILSEDVIDAFAAEAAGSPQLMQSICLQACFEMDIRTELPRPRDVVISPDRVERIFERTAAATNYRTLVDILEGGPKTRGTERKMYKFKDGTEGDVYRCILRAIAADPPRLSFEYSDILRRVGAVCDGEQPVGSSIAGSCLHMAKLAADKQPDEHVLDWDETKPVLDVPYPYLVFYLRWSGHIR